MAIKLHMDVLLPKKVEKKSIELLSNKLADANVIKRINPKKVKEITKHGEITMELIEGLTVECHISGCFHFDCEDFNEKKLDLISKAFVVLSEIYDIREESKEVEFWLFATEQKIPRNIVIKTIGKAVKADLEAKVKNLYQEDVKMAGIRFVSAPNLSIVIDITGVNLRMGPLKMTLDRFKDETTVIELIEKSIGRIKKVLED